MYIYMCIGLQCSRYIDEFMMHMLIERYFTGSMCTFIAIGFLLVRITLPPSLVISSAEAVGKMRAMLAANRTFRCLPAKKRKAIESTSAAFFTFYLHR